MSRFSRQQLKDHFAEARQFLNRTILALILIGLFTGVTITRLVYLQIIDHPHYTTLSNDNRVKITPIAPTRGLIYDRNGVILAENLPSYRLEIIPEQVGNMDAMLEQLATLVEINDEHSKRFRRALKRKRSFQAIPLRFLLSDAEVARVAAIQHRLPGVRITAGLTRHYPLGKATSHVVGYLGRIDERDLKRVDGTNYSASTHIGKTGIEKFYEDILHGKVGLQQVETNAQGRVMRVLKKTPPTPGMNLHLTLDTGLQRLAEQLFKAENGSLVAIDPNNGEVLALVSTPGYDPNAFVNGISHADFKTLRENPAQPLYNRALQGRYPPGSIIKPFLGLLGLDANVTSKHYELFCPGYYLLPGEERKFRDWKKSGHGTVDLDQAITQSCDVYFYDLALNLGIDRIAPFLAMFGFGQVSGIDMPVESAGLLPSREWKRTARGQAWYPGETLNTGIGQGFLLSTPLQLASATATLAMRGKRMRPHLLRNIDQQKISPDAVYELPGVNNVAAHNWDYIIDAMEHVVTGRQGTARRIATRKYRIAGKTGTAQVFGIKQEEKYDADKIAKKLHDHALFIGFAPVEKPRIAVAVIVENGGSGGRVASPIVGQLINYFMRDGSS